MTRGYIITKEKDFLLSKYYDTIMTRHKLNQYITYSDLYSDKSISTCERIKLWKLERDGSSHTTPIVNINAYIRRQLSFVLSSQPLRLYDFHQIKLKLFAFLLLLPSIDHLEAMSIIERVKHWYFVYELRTSLYMMEPWEKGLFSKYYRFLHWFLLTLFF